MEHLRSGTLEDILKRLEVRDLIRCKGVCKYWSSLISGALFIKSHLKHNLLSDRNNAEVGHRRISICTYPAYDQFNHDRYLVGSCNGLVCISPRFNELVVINPLTREVINIPNPQIPRTNSLCWGFGYDSIYDDYTIVLGFRKGENHTCFQTFYLRSRFWFTIGEVNRLFVSTRGVFFKGMLHWLAYDNLSRQKDVVVSFHLTDETFCEIPQPEMIYPIYFGRVRASACLGIMEDCLCIFHPSSPPSKVWVMKDYNNGQPWELVVHACENKYDLVHCIKLLTNYIQDKRPLCYETLYCDSRAFLSGSLFVESLVSPHSQEPEGNTLWRS